MTQLTTAFLGAAHIHSPDFVRRLNLRSDAIHVKYVTDTNAERGQKSTVELPGATFATDIQTVLDDPEVTSVIVCAETNQHRDLVVAAAQAGKNIFCEKPLGLGAADSSLMADAILKAGVIFQTGFMQRGHSVSQFVKQELAAGHLGKITRVRYSNCHMAALDGWFDTDWLWMTDPKVAGGGAMLDMGAHMLDLILNTYRKTEGEVVGLSAALGNRNGRYGTKVDEYGSALLSFESGAIAEFEASWVDPRITSPLEVFGTEGQIQMLDGQVRYFSKHVEGADGKTPYKNLPTEQPHAFELFLDVLLGVPIAIPLVTVEEAALGSTIMERLYHFTGRSTTEGLV